MAVFVSLLQTQELSWRREVIVEILGKLKALFSKQFNSSPSPGRKSPPPPFFKSANVARLKDFLGILKQS